MKKRVLAGVLWFLSAWYAWNVLASFAGLTDLAGPLIGLAAAFLFAVDPLGRIWPHAAPVPAMVPETDAQSDRQPVAGPA